MYLISFVNQDLADNIKNIIHDFTNVNASNNFISDLLVKLTAPLKSIFNIGQTNIGKIVQEAIIPEQKVDKGEKFERFETVTHTSLYDGTGYLSGGNTKNLANTARSDSKNIFT